MQALTVDINHLEPGKRYKFVNNNQNNNIYSGIYEGSYDVNGIAIPGQNQVMLMFDKVVNETNGLEQGSMHILADFITEIYAVVSARSGKLPADIGREISNYGGKRNTMRKRKRKRNKNKNKTKNRRQKRKTKTRKLKR
jgi:hypothetical protein